MNTSSNLLVHDFLDCIKNYKGQQRYIHKLYHQCATKMLL